MQRLPPLNALRCFAVVVRAGSFTKAAMQLHVTQAAVSRQIKLLEQHLGAPLFVRAHQRIELTESGRELAQITEETFGLLERGLRRMSSARQRQRLNINLPPTFATRWLAPRLPQFCALYPDVDMHITTEWVRSVQQGQQALYDCLVVFDREPWTQAPCEALMLERHVLVCAPQLWHANISAALRGRALLHILNGEERLPVWEHWLERFPIAGVDPKPGLSFSTLDQAINATMNGAGIAIVDEAMIQPELQQGKLKLLSPERMIGPCGYWFVALADKSERQALVSTFSAWLREQASRQLEDASLASASLAG